MIEDEPTAMVQVTSNRVLAGFTAAFLAVAVALTAWGTALGNHTIEFAGYFLFIWAGGGSFLAVGPWLKDHGYDVAGEAVRRSVAWFFLTYLGWSWLYYTTHVLPENLLVYEGLVYITTVALSGLTALVMSETGPSRDIRPSLGSTLVGLFVLGLFYVYRYLSHTWTPTTTIAFFATGLVTVIVYYHPEWLPGVKPQT